YVLEEPLYVADEVAREDDRAGVLGVVGEEDVVERVAVRGVEAEVGLVEDRQRGAGGQADDDAERGALTAREPLGVRADVEAEEPDEVLGEVGVPAGADLGVERGRVARRGA